MAVQQTIRPTNPWKLWFNNNFSLMLAVAIWSSLGLWVIQYPFEAEEPASAAHFETSHQFKEIWKHDLQLTDFTIEILAQNQPRCLLRAGKGYADTSPERGALLFELVDGVQALIYAGTDEATATTQTDPTDLQFSHTLISAREGTYMLTENDTQEFTLRGNVRIERLTPEGVIMDTISTERVTYNNQTDLLATDQLCHVTSEQHGNWMSQGLQTDSQFSFFRAHIIPPTPAAIKTPQRAFGEL